MTKICIELDIKNCSDCPRVKSERTVGAGYAFDYFCKDMDNRKIMGYVEYSSDYEPVPTWCPHLKKEVNDG